LRPNSGADTILYALKQGDTKLALEFDTEMHRAILEASGNRRPQEIMVTINGYVALFRNIGARTPFHRGYTCRHRKIIRGLERRDRTWEPGCFPNISRWRKRGVPGLPRAQAAQAER